MKRAGRLLVSLSLIALLVAAGAWGARSYLTSRHVADKVAAQISAFYGGPLQLDSVDIGMGGSSARGLRLFEMEGEDREPWLNVESMRADLSAWDLLGADPAPATLQLDGASLTLRFDAAGQLLTRLPPRPARKGRSLPSLHLVNGAVTIRQQGRPEFVVRGVDASLETQQGQLLVKGTVTDPFWGAWTLSGRIDPETGVAESLLATDRTDATMAKLRAIPFVSPNVWEQVQIDAQTPVQLQLRFDPAMGSCKYRVELHPEHAAVYVHAISLQSDHVEGAVIIEDGLVTLRDLRGRTADGAIHTSADLDFRQPVRQMRFSISVSKVDTHRLPKVWRLPVLIGGRLTGEALLNVLVGGEPRVLTTGDGKGLLNGAIPVHLRANSSGFHFSL